MKQLFILIFAAVCFMSADSMGYTYVYLEDGGSHTIDHSLYQDDFVGLDVFVVNNPGTHLELVDGGDIWYLQGQNYSTIEIAGGSIGSGLSATDSSMVEIIGGSIGTNIWAEGSSSISICGGSIGGSIASQENGTIEISGGSISGGLSAGHYGVIYLYGSDFSVGGVDLNFGDSLRDYGIIGGPHYGDLVGTVTGLLQDGTAMNNAFSISEASDADIIIVPEPLSITLFGLGGLFLRTRKH